MGCCGSKDQDLTVQTGRRRLSVSGTGGGENDADDAEVNEAERGLITELDSKSVEEIINDANVEGGRKMSMGSVTDTNKQNFAEKQLATQGTGYEPKDSGIGYTCRKGLKPESPNQDSWFVLKMEKKSIYAVFDGHGQRGHDVSNYVKENLPKLMLKDQAFESTDQAEIGPMMIRCFKKMQALIRQADRMKKLSAQMSGTTCTVVIHDTENGKLHVAHVADSTCVLGKTNKSAVALTRDHKPDLKDERARIERNGGRVVFDGYANHRVYAKNEKFPGLNMSRCLGDTRGHETCGITCEPEYKCIQLKDEDHVLLLCSDGVWEFIEPKEAVGLVMNFKSEKAGTAADKLAKEAWDRWIREEGGAVVDDITVVLVYLKHDKEQSGNDA
mmetsp:Transcript_81354/g.230524  ORF Transcript_81354/g.230524 Transcript_81354/m.230524 type:complete len:386 (-) Transcript_81354:173-1330(-)